MIRIKSSQRRKSDAIHRRIFKDLSGEREDAASLRQAWVACAGAGGCGDGLSLLSHATDRASQALRIFFSGDSQFPRCRRWRRTTDQAAAAGNDSAAQGAGAGAHSQGALGAPGEF